MDDRDADIVWSALPAMRGTKSIEDFMTSPVPTVPRTHPATRQPLGITDETPLANAFGEGGGVGGSTWRVRHDGEQARE